VKVRREIDVVIGGFTAGEGGRASTFGSLLVGRRDGGALHFAGGVGTGFDQATLESLGARLRALATDEHPFAEQPPAAYRRRATWVEPELVARIEIAELTNDGYVRHASFLHLVE
jgi:bifunctional non-homologous end joining protein LigD